MGIGTPQNLLNAYQAKLVLDQAPGSLFDKLGGRIGHLLVAHDDELPHLVWEVVDNPLDRFFDGPVSYDMRIRNIIWTDRRIDLADPTGGATIEQSLVDLMDEFSLVAAGFDRGLVLFVNRAVRSTVGDFIALQSDCRIRGTAF